MSPPSPVAIVSGGTRGLGEVVVRRLLDSGYRVATFSRKRTPALEELEVRFGPEILKWRSLDVTRPEDVRAFVQEVTRTFGRLDALINNAATLRQGLFALSRVADLDDLVRTNLLGVMALTQACSRHMLTQNFGSVVNISSVSALRGYRGTAAYGATKAALEALTRGLARELGSYNIRVNSVSPGFFESDMVSSMSDAQRADIKRRTPLGRLCRIDEIASVILFLISQEASFVTGQTLVVDGGITC